jgi:hypothetical protein
MPDGPAIGDTCAGYVVAPTFAIAQPLFLRTSFAFLMSRTSRISTVAPRARQSKTMLLPMPRKEVDRVCLPVHIALDAMRRGKGSNDGAQALCQAMILVSFLIEDGYGDATAQQVRRAGDAISFAVRHGCDAGVWSLDEAGFNAIAKVIAAYDKQLRDAPLAAIFNASKRLERLQIEQSVNLN